MPIGYGWRHVNDCGINGEIADIKENGIDYIALRYLTEEKDGIDGCDGLIVRDDGKFITITAFKEGEIARMVLILKVEEILRE